ncbi:MAG: hypothetical protein RR219_01180 [Clostridiales bacterium]
MEHKVKRKLTIRSVLSFLVILVLIRQIFLGNYENIFTCCLTLILFCIPVFVDKHMGIDLPPLLEKIILCFIFSAEILGEINSFYTIIPFWDTILHVINGFLMAAIGFSLVDIFNRSEHFALELSPLFVALVAFCFSMTIGILWEFFEWTMDMFFAMDMQKDAIVTSINSVIFNAQGLNITEHVEINSLVVNGEDWLGKYGGYIDVGLFDTMKDLFVNFIGAVVFSVIGYFYIKSRGKGEFAKQFIPVVKENEE